MRKIGSFALAMCLATVAVGADETRTGSAPNVAPKGFKALFNGKNLDGWFALGHTNPYEFARWSEAERASHMEKAEAELREHWKAAGGEIINDGAGDFLTTRDSFRDFELLLDWQMVSPNGDSGIYLRMCPQVQIWDPNNAREKGNGADKGSGALWNNNPDAPGRFPPVVADAPIGEWNSFRIVMVGERVSVWLNGKKTVDNAVMNNFWDRKRPVPASGPIQLQTHGSETRFRNIFIREISPEEAGKTLLAAEDEGFKAAFSGKDLDGWVGDTKAYKARDGILTFAAEGHGGDVFLKDTYDNFVIRYEFKVPPGGNNGLLIRTPDTRPGGSFSGMEVQLLDDGDKQYANLQPWQYCGSLYGLIPAHRGYMRKPGEWNFMEVMADGPKIRVNLNGTVITQGDLSKIEKPLHGHDHPGLKRTEGYVGFMGHGSPVEFRNIKIKRLK